MLSREENEVMTRVGPGTAMGDLMRRYWQPVLLSTELPEADGPPLRVRLLGEDLVAFRANDGRVGLLGANCCHRGAPLYFGRNEEGGLRCVYHGWKYDVEGRCVDMPNVPPERTYKDKVRQKAYRCEERNGIVWAYLGSGVEPPLPELDWALAPAERRHIGKQYLACNWVQTLEGDFDPTHSSFLHGRRGTPDGAQPSASGHALSPQAREESIRAKERHALVVVMHTDDGLLLGARRDAGEDYYWRFNQFVLPFYAWVPGRIGNPRHCNAWVPIDDENTMVWRVDYQVDRPLNEAELSRLRSGMASNVGAEWYSEPTTEPGGMWRPKQNKGNDYLIDWEVQRTTQFLGIRGIWAQDAAVTEGMGPIYDRTQEHLGAGDVGIIQLRRLLIEAAKAHVQHGAHPPGLFARPRVMSAEILFLPKDLSWEKLADQLLAGELKMGAGG